VNHSSPPPPPQQQQEERNTVAAAFAQLVGTERFGENGFWAFYGETSGARRYIHTTTIWYCTRVVVEVHNIIICNIIIFRSNPTDIIGIAVSVHRRAKQNKNKNTETHKIYRNSVIVCIKHD